MTSSADAMMLRVAGLFIGVGPELGELIAAHAFDFMVDSLLWLPRSILALCG
jgi:hypothetical protein